MSDNTEKNEPSLGAEAPAAQAVAAAPAAKTAPAVAGVSLMGAVIISLICSAFSGWLAWHLSSRASLGGATPVVLLDSVAIMNKKLEDVVNTRGMTQERAATEAKEFALAIKKVMDDYNEAGIILINSTAAVNRPPSLDVTEMVAKRLGVSGVKRTTIAENEGISVSGKVPADAASGAPGMGGR